MNTPSTATALEPFSFAQYQLDRKKMQQALDKVEREKKDRQNELKVEGRKRKALEALSKN
jgi:type III secretory pathway component EscU